MDLALLGGREHLVEGKQQGQILRARRGTGGSQGAKRGKPRRRS